MHPADMKSDPPNAEQLARRVPPSELAGRSEPVACDGCEGAR